ncbi:hypothetical protein NPIL_696501, partial [Nephila pilipes]
VVAGSVYVLLCLDRHMDDMPDLTDHIRQSHMVR